MVDRLEENLGKYPYVTLAQVKDYLSISSNTADARLSNVINYATGMVEHYIGQEVLANDYVEIFDGCLLYTSPSPRDQRGYRMPSSA